MCGILGIYSRRGIDRQRATAQRDTLIHRGPDDAGAWWSPDGMVGMLHRRLSVIDLSPLGHQPMLSPDGRLVIVFNGEIYNHGDLRSELAAKGHHFRSQSDTEVILHAYLEWGERCVERLLGAFAFAIYDTGASRIFLARDRAGEKPLFLYEGPEGIQFASEVKAILADPSIPRRLDAEAVQCYLAFGYAPGSRCLLKGFRKLCPGHSASINLKSGQIKIWPYWSLPERSPEAEVASEEDLVEEAEALLDDAVRRQLVADVPIGVLLSGGVDSSLVTALAARHATRVRTFTISFPGHGRFDESEYARQVASHFGTDHVQLEASPASVDLLETLARQVDDPVADSSVIPTFLVSQLTRRHCTVALGGDGGDEVFGGYRHYNRLIRLQARAHRIPLFVRRAGAGILDRILPGLMSGRATLTDFGSDFGSTLPAPVPFFNQKLRLELLGGERIAQGGGELPEDLWEKQVCPGKDLLDRATRTDFRNYLPDDVLVKVDRASMLSSLEVRAPLLDHRFVEFGFRSVPGRLKANQAGRKVLLRRLADRLLPDSFDSSRKQGFTIPLHEWMREDRWRNAFREILLGSDVCCLRKRLLAKLLQQSTSPQASNRLFCLVNFELWRRNYRAGW